MESNTISGTEGTRQAPDNANTEDEITSRRVNVYLAEFNNLRAEQLKRIDSQNQALNYLFIILGITVTAIVGNLDDRETLPVVLCWIGLLLPLVTAPLGFMFFDHEMATHSIGSHIYWHLRHANLACLVKDDGIMGASLDFKYLHRSSARVHSALSYGRWMLFLIPTMLPVGALFFLSVLVWGWWRPYLEGPLPVPAGLIFGGAVTIWLVGAVASFLIVLAGFWGLVKYDLDAESMWHGIRGLPWGMKGSHEQERAVRAARVNC